MTAARFLKRQDGLGRISAMDLISLLANAVIAQAETSSLGDFLQHRQPLQEVTLMRTIYRGECPGERVEPIKTMSFLAPTPPGGRQRIVITNQRTGGYTDREYGDNRDRAEGFWISLGTQHRGSFLSVQPGNNVFDWSITQPTDSTLPIKGTATLQVRVEEQTRYRDFSSINEDAYCPGEKYQTLSRTPLSECPSRSYIEEREGVCPNGSTIALGKRTIYRRRPYRRRWGW